MKRHITLTIIIATISIVPANAQNGKFKNWLKNTAQFVSAAVFEQTCEYAGYSKEESQQMTRDLCTALGANITNIERGLNYVAASDKYEKQNVIKDYAFDLAGDVSGNSQMVESFRKLTDANLEYLHDNSTATSDEERQLAFDKRTQAYADVFYDTYQYGKQRRARHLSEKLKMEQKLTSQGMDPSMANELAGSLIAVQNSKDWTQEEKEEYFNSFGLDLDANVIAVVASYSEEYLIQQEEEARKIEEEEEQKKEEERKRKEAEERRVALEKLGNTSIPTYSFDNVDLVEEQMLQLDTIADIMKKYDDIQLSIIGHTCKIGYKSINLKKGLKRAEQCKIYLVEKGIAESRITTDSKGELAPKYDNKTLLGRAQNRRVEISIIEQSSLEE